MLKEDNIFKFYYVLSVLKDMPRQGPIHWGVEKKEAIGSHVFGCLMLAIGLYSELKPNIDFEKTFLMIAVHETGECIIGDFTILDNKTHEEKRGLGDVAVSKIFSLLKSKHDYIDLINEYNEGKTKEACFAKACDKLECVLQFKKYVDAGLTGFSKVTPEILKKKEIKHYYDNKKYDLADAFFLFYLSYYERYGIDEEYWFKNLKHLSTDINDILK